ncbi:MAG: hypothetical protein KME54_26460 [Tolypothrix brevis GSE-NOS-MK-07-07A]|jgi:hypothetical protein|nr:hypothetical protein [Tolypothrix brevis GSE-NOS-MK-07-07A]
MNIILLEKLLARPIAFHRIFATVAGGATEGLFLSQAYYWSFRTTIDGEWFYKTQEEWYQETVLTRREQAAARKKLIALHILEEKREGMPSQLFYKVNKEKLYEIILGEDSNPHGYKIVQNDNLVDSRLSDVANKIVQSDIQSIYTEITSETTPPLSPQGEDVCKRKFGFEIKENLELVPQHSTSLDKKPEVTQLTSDIVVGIIVPAPAEIQKTKPLPSESVHPIAKMESRFNLKQTVRQQRREYLDAVAHPSLVFSENTPWLEPNSTAEMPIFHRPFVAWGAGCIMKFASTTLERAKGNFETKLINDPRKIAIEWRAYSDALVHTAVVVAARVNNGISVGQDELDNLAKNQRAFTLITAESTESIDPKILVSAQQVSHEPPQLESAATVSDDIWDTIAAKTLWEQSQFSVPIPDGAENIAAYTNTAKSEDSDYFRALHEKHLTCGIQPIAQPISSLEEAKARIDALTPKMGMPSVSAEDKQRMRDEERLGNKLAYWTELLQSGIPSVIADVTRRANAQGYEIIDGEIFEVDF